MGITTMLMDEGMDTGPMLLKSYLPLGLLDNAEQVSHQLAQQGANLLKETLLALEQGTIKAIPQDNSLATYAPLIQKTDYLLDWNRTSVSLHNQIRGFFPNCQTIFRGELLKVTSSLPLQDEYTKHLSW